MTNGDKAERLIDIVQSALTFFHPLPNELSSHEVFRDVANCAQEFIDSKGTSRHDDFKCLRRQIDTLERDTDSTLCKDYCFAANALLWCVSFAESGFTALADNWASQVESDVKNCGK